MRFAVIGASGRIGECILREALMRKCAVTAVVRDESAFKPSQADGRSPTVAKRTSFSQRSSRRRSGTPRW
jgi:putative NADH-flavin reductase